MINLHIHGVERIEVGEIQIREGTVWRDLHIHTKGEVNGVVLFPRSTSDLAQLTVEGSFDYREQWEHAQDEIATLRAELEEARRRLREYES